MNHLSNNDGQRLLKCGVCGKVTQRNKKLCIACYAFFYRNLGKNLECQSGTNQCPMTELFAIQVSNGSVWRNLCKKCRLDRCLQIVTMNSKTNVNH